MKRASLLQPVALCAALSLSATLGCGPEFDPSSEVKTLRVLGVKKDKPYAQAGDAVNLQLLWHDPQDRDVQRLFIGGCVNPPGDLYYGCFQRFAEQAQEGTLPPLGEGDTFQVTLPDDIISGRQGQVDPGQERYGVYIVFFAVCAGRLDLAMGASAGSGAPELPVRCLDGDKPLGSDDFIVGYSTIYSFEDAANGNPAFTVDDAGKGEFLVAGEPVVADCVGEACQAAPSVDVDCEETPARCIAPCDDDGDSSCPAIEVAPAISQDVVEQDTVSSRLFGESVSEQMWVNYYVDRGGISEVRLLNNSTTGWNAKYRGQLRAPKEPGPLQLWSVSHDNRGGMDFARVTLRVREE